jgi:uncharacterized protein with FMN-binding domain
VRRIILGLLGTVIGTAVLVGLKAPGGRIVDVVAAGRLDPGAGTDTPEPTSRITVTSTPSKPARPHTPTTTSRRPPTRTTTTTAAAARTRSILGDAFPARDFGEVQVRVVLTGSHIDDVVVVQMSNRPRNAPDRLRQEALTKQSANLTNISGATYTSQAYMRSLQSALDKV